MTTMKAAVIHEPGGPEVLTIESRPVPVPKPGEVLIRVKAFGLNRSEMFTRQGLSPGVPLPAHPRHRGGRHRRGGAGRRVRGRRHGRDRHGRHGAAVRRQLRRIHLRAGRPGAGAARRTCPGRCSAPCRRCCRPPGARSSRRCASHAGERLLVRGGTTSVGLAAAAIAKAHGVTVAATTRNPASADLLRANGADAVFIDDGAIAGAVRRDASGRRSTRCSNSSAPRR